MSRFTCVMFDMDGSLIDSERVYIKAWKEVFIKHKIDISKDQIHSWTGLGWLKIKEEINQVTQDEAQILLLREQREEYFYQALHQNEVLLKKNALLYLQYLKKHQIKIGLVTSTFKEKALNILSHFELLPFFDFMVFGDEVAQSKPHPEIYEHAIKLSEKKKEQCIVFEDSRNGILSATEAGLQVIQIIDYVDFELPNTLILARIHDYQEAIQLFEVK